MLPEKEDNEDRIVVTVDDEDHEFYSPEEAIEFLNSLKYVDDPYNNAEDRLRILQGTATAESIFESQMEALRYREPGTWDDPEFRLQKFQER